MKLAVLCASYNRREVTLKGLASLVEALDSSDWDYEIFLLDDSSPDGTADAVRNFFPSINVIEGSGNLFWNRGMCAAFDASLQRGPFDCYLLYNDDVVVDKESLSGFLAEYIAINVSAPAILVGATLSQVDRSITYSAYLQTSKLKALSFSQIHKLDGLRSCDVFNGNFVLIPGPFFREVGGLDGNYHHGLGDIDLGLVAARHGVRKFLHGKAIGFCEKGASIEQRLTRGNLSNRWRLLFSEPNGIGPYAHFVWKHRPKALFPLYLAWTFASRAKSLVRASE